MFNWLKRFNIFGNKDKQNVTVCQAREHVGPHLPSPIPGKLIESISNTEPIPGMLTLSIGNRDVVIEMDNGELVTMQEKNGILCGCGHQVFSISQAVADGIVHKGIGGVCRYCSLEASILLNQGAISLHQAESMSLYCTTCVGRCQACGGNVCSRHVKEFQPVEGDCLYLCPECLKKAENERFFQKTAFLSLSILYENRRPPK